MACLSVSDESWASSSLPKMPSERLSRLHLHNNDDEEEDEKDGENSFFGSESTAYKLERVFPVYALGISRPSSDTAIFGSLDDPIWLAVTREAKSVVIN